MCGLCGYLRHDPQDTADLHIVSTMAAALAHRGPNAQGLWADGAMALGHRRLSIIDLSVEGNQPMANEDETVVAVVNGEIYNFPELRRSLEQKGHRFRSHSDSEVVVHLYEELGPDLVLELRGMFALAVWDLKRRRLVLARDRLGEKPLYYAPLPGGLLFASEATAIVRGLRAVGEHGDEVDRRAASKRLAPDLASIDSYLALQYVPPPRTAFDGVAKLPAAHRLVVEPGKPPALERYWRLSFAPRADRPQTLDAAAEELKPRLEEAVQMRLMADVPLGAFLSGGVDSSAIVGLMARRSSRPVKTFSIDFRGATGEAHWARQVADRWNTDHHELVVEPDMVHILPELVQRYGEPFGDTSAVPVYYLSKLTKEHVTVALSGDGGDEVFGGYRRYVWDKLARHVRSLGTTGVGAVQALLGRLPATGRGQRVLDPLRRFGEHLDLDLAARYLPFVAHFAPRDKRTLYGPAFWERLGRVPTEIDPVVRWFDSIVQRSDAVDDIHRLLDLDSQTYLPDDIFVKVDIASMAHALEVRAPFVDHPLVEWVASLPSHLKLQGLVGKRLLRHAVRDVVPKAILERKKKGFSLPLDSWFRGPLRAMAHDLLTDSVSRQRGLLNPAAVQQLLDEQARGIDHGERLWNLVVLELWYREHGFA